MGLNLTTQYIDETFQKLVQVSGSFITDGTGSLITQLEVTASNATNAVNANIANSSLTATSASYALTASYALNSVPQVSASYATSASHALNSDNSISSSYAVSALSSSYSNTSTSASHALVADTSISSSYALTASFALNVVDPAWNDITGKPAGLVSGSEQIDLSLATGVAANATNAVNALTASIVTDTNIAYKNVNNVFTGTQTFNTITANSASFGHVTSVTGSAVIIGESIIVLNNDTPTQRYAGIAVYDSGSAFTTASFQFDGENNDWFFEKQVVGVTELGTALFGPEYTVKGSPIYNTNNVLTKGNGGHHLQNSTITDTGTAISTTVGITAPSFTGSLSGNATTADALTPGMKSISQLTITGGTGTDLAVTGTATFTSNVSSNASVIAGTTTKAYLNTQFIGIIDTVTADEIGFTENGNEYGISGWAGPAIYANDPTDSYPALIGFQNKADWTDGRVTFLTPIIAGNTQITGSLTVTGSLVANYGATPPGNEQNIFTWDQPNDPFGKSYDISKYSLYAYGGTTYNGVGFEIWDSNGYNYGVEQNISPTRINNYVQGPSGSYAQELLRYIEPAGATQFQTQKLISADNIEIQARSPRGGALSFNYQNSSGSSAASSSFATFQCGQNYGDPTRTQMTFDANDIQFGVYGPNNGTGQISLGGTGHTTQIKLSAQKILTEGPSKVLSSYSTPIGATNIDSSTGNSFWFQPTGATDFTITGAVSDGSTQVLNILIDAGGHAITFTNVEWPGGTAPTLVGRNVVTIVIYHTSAILGTAVENFS